MISYYWPPAGGPGVQRTLKFVRYLPQFGWQPVVLTVRDADYPARDETLGDEVPPDVPIVRTFIPEPYALYRRLTGRPADTPVDVTVRALDEQERRKPAERLAGWVRAAFFVPDARVGWLPFAVAAGLRAIRRHQAAVLYTSAPPYTCHLIGLWLKRLTGLPWVADFRDSWVGWLSAPRYRPWPSRWVDRAQERAVVTHADWRVVASAGIRTDLRRRTPDRPGRRWNVITNGYDPADFAAARPAGRDSRFTVVYTGSLYGHRHPVPLLRAIDTLRCSAPEVARDLRLRFVGRMGAAIAEELRGEPYRDIVELIPYVPHRESLGYLLGADLLLLIVGAGRHGKAITTGKVFEYLGARRPVLAVAPPDGPAARLVRGLHAGIVADPAHPSAVAHALARCHVLWRAGALHEWTANATRLAPFHRRALTGRLAAILNRLCAGQGKRA